MKIFNALSDWGNGVFFVGVLELAYVIVLCYGVIGSFLKMK